jgi:hypothetical protein
MHLSKLFRPKYEEVRLLAQSVATYKASGTSFNLIRRHVLFKGLVLALNRGR